MLAALASILNVGILTVSAGLVIYLTVVVAIGRCLGLNDRMPAPTDTEVWTTFIRLVDRLSESEILFLLDEYQCDLRIASVSGHGLRVAQLERRVEWLADAYGALQDIESLRF